MNFTTFARNAFGSMVDMSDMTSIGVATKSSPDGDEATYVRACWGDGRNKVMFVGPQGECKEYINWLAIQLGAATYKKVTK